MPSPHSILAPLALMLAAAPALAAYDAGDVFGPGVFATACVTPTGSGIPFPSADLQLVMGSQGTCDSRLVNGLDPAAASEGLRQPTARATASAQLGVIGLTSSIETEGVDGRPRSAASGGFADRLIIDSPGATGLPGHLVVNIGVQGLMRAAGEGGAVRLGLEGQSNNMTPAQGPGFDQGSGTAFGTQQFIGWLVFHDSDRGASTLALDEVVRLSLPFVFGQAFEFGIWASVLADTQEVDQASFSFADFSSGLSWLGIEGAWVRETRFTTDLSLQSASGISWAQPVPEPSAAALMLLGLLALPMLGRRVRASAPAPADVRRRQRASGRARGFSVVAVARSATPGEKVQSR